MALLVAGDGSASWGNLPSGPSESECRPYIEKALQQGASVHDPIGQYLIFSNSVNKTVKRRNETKNMTNLPAIPLGF